MTNSNRRESLLTISEVALIIQIHQVTLRDWVRAGKFPAIRTGRRYRIDPGDLKAWLDQRRRVASDNPTRRRFNPASRVAAV